MRPKDSSSEPSWLSSPVHAREPRRDPQITVKPGEEPPRGETDWERVNAMTDEEVLAAALSDPDAQPLDSETLAKMRRISAKT
jgi:hypothetical protein